MPICFWQIKTFATSFFLMLFTRYFPVLSTFALLALFLATICNLLYVRNPFRFHDHIRFRFHVYIRIHVYIPSPSLRYHISEHSYLASLSNLVLRLLPCLPNIPRHTLALLMLQCFLVSISYSLYEY